MVLLRWAQSDELIGILSLAKLRYRNSQDFSGFFKNLQNFVNVVSMTKSITY